MFCRNASCDAFSGMSSWNPPTSAFPCLNNPPLNTDGANALGGFRALLRRGYSTNMRETCRNVPGTLVCPPFFYGKEGIITGEGKGSI